MSAVILTQRLLNDNLSYIVHREGSTDALVIDPSEAGPVLQRLRHEGLKLRLILNTHHHHDHVGGNTDLARATGAEVWCSLIDVPRVPLASRGLNDHERFEFDGLTFQVLAIPGHTRGQIAFYIPDEHALFVGDTVFAMGCGRLFEGTAEEMFTSLLRIAGLPPETRLYFGHDYLERNAGFAIQIFPGDSAILRRLNTLELAPRLNEEKAVNPFFRSFLQADRVRNALAMPEASELELFTELRRRRDSF